MGDEQQAVVAAEEHTPPPPVDAEVQLLVDKAQMTAEMRISPPQHGGADITRDAIDAALSKEGVVFGVNEEALARLAAPLYGQKLVVARGAEPKDGTDGTCEELFAREAEKQMVQRQDGSVDYKQLGLIRDVQVGTVICKLQPPTQGENGTTVTGKTLKARDGVAAVPPVGENVKLNEDGTAAVTMAEGNLVFRSGHFVVEDTVRLENVDYETGNITFSGHVVVNGDMLDGFEISAGGNVTLRGQVGSVVVQGANITIENGINGTGKAQLVATGTIKAGFVENCNIRVGEKLVAQSLINSQVECEGEVEVTGGKGVICGGRVTAFGSVRAKEVGNDFNTPTNITLGVTPKLLKDKKRLEAKIADIERHMDELNKNAAYIEQLVAKGKPVPPERVQMLKRAQIQLPLSGRKRDQLHTQLAELEEKLSGTGGATLTARVIHPPTRVTIGTTSANLDEMRSNCRVYKSKEGAIVFGSA